jgi:hypothetical protein
MQPAFLFRCDNLKTKFLLGATKNCEKIIVRKMLVFFLPLLRVTLSCLMPGIPVIRVKEIQDGANIHLPYRVIQSK